MEHVRHGTGLVIATAALGLLCHAVIILRGRDYLGCATLVLTGLSLLRAATELLRPSDGS